MRLHTWLQNTLHWIRELNNEDSDMSENSHTFRLSIAITASIVGGLVSNIFATWIAQEVLNYSFHLALVISMVVALVLMAVLQVKGLPFRVMPLKIIAVLLTIVILQSVIIAYIHIRHQPVTTYLVFDATDATISNYSDLITNIRLAAQVQAPNSWGGLRIYGGQVQGETDCQDTTQLIPPIPGKDFENELDKAFGSFDPKGNASLTVAVMEAITHDLKTVRGPVKLIVITSGLDARCEPEASGTFEAIAEVIRSNTTKDIQIAIIGVGDISDAEEHMLNNYAEAFNGRYLNASKPAQLNSLILASPGYFSDSMAVVPTPRASP